MTWTRDGHHYTLIGLTMSGIILSEYYSALGRVTITVNLIALDVGSIQGRRSNMGYVEFYNETTGEWTNIEDVPLFDTINCQLCNEPTEAHDIVAEIKFKDDQPVVGAWQCRKCKAVNG